jgi:hypothetical protein
MAKRQPDWETKKYDGRNDRGGRADKFSVHGLFLALSYPLTLVVVGPKWEGVAVVLWGFYHGSISARA